MGSPKNRTLKKYGSLWKIQDRVLSKVEKRRRSCGISRSKNKAEDNQDSILSGRSLSDSDIKLKWERARKEARLALAFGKRIGLTIHGNEEEEVRKVNSLVKGYNLEILLRQETMKIVWSEEQTSKGKKVGELNGWWYSPKKLRALKLELKRMAECPYKFTVAFAVIKRRWGIGGVLLSGKGDIRAIFSGPSLCCSMLHAEIEATNLAQLIFIEAGHSVKSSLLGGNKPSGCGG
ncbi:hypothetical protein V6N12_047573 [Hibiscus sabdariffa]|uniref:RNase H type-1 domain-containing protein n=1 Tax=Hibiscus sabdariffa TaxID=183260 RepID=A0ABR2ADM9_9ROSI